MEIISLDIPELGNRSYIIHDGTKAVVVDPSRRIDEITSVAEKAGLTISAVFETHVHNDYITGGFALAAKLQIPYYISEDDEVTFESKKIGHEQSIHIGKLSITALSSPGHTKHHLSYLLEQAGSTPALFSGGSLLYGAVGRTDLISANDTKPLAHAQYQTAQYFVQRLRPDTILYPTHGFGSFCAAMDTESLAFSTIAEQMQTNHVYTAKSAEEFVGSLISGLDDFPSYYAYMAPLNSKGPEAAQLEAPAVLKKETVLAAIHSGAGVIDVRNRIAYAAKHIQGTYNIEASNELATYVGWLLAWDRPVIIVAPEISQVATIQEQLSLIGREVLNGQIAADSLFSDSEGQSYEVRNFKDLKEALGSKEVQIIDVRRKSEWQKGHIPNAINIPLHMLEASMSKLSKDTEYWVHCKSGFRAAIAASILDSNNMPAVLVNDDYNNALEAGLLAIHRQAYVDQVEAGKAVLIDVRDDAEWDISHAKGAIHLPLGAIVSGAQLNFDQNIPVYLYCETGERSGMAAHYLSGVGYNTIDIGGLINWITDGGDVVSAA